MFKYAKAFLFDDYTVVLNKEDIHNAKDEDFKEITLLISDDFIKESYAEIEFMEDEKEWH